MTIIGITGTIGAGKGEIVSYLETRGFEHFSVRTYLTRELEKRGMPVNRPTMTDLADELRRKHRPGYIVEELYRQAAATGKDSVIESVRNIGEVDYLKHQKNFVLIAVESDIKIRYDRIVRRNSALDHVTFEQFERDNAREMASTDEAKGNIAECIRRSDFRVENDGTIPELRVKIDKILKMIRG